MIEKGELKILKQNGEVKVFSIEILDEWKILEQKQIRG
jgi:hypothetical protein